MIALREFVKVKNHQVHIQLPSDFDCDEVEVVILPKENEKEIINKLDFSSVDSIGKVGFNSQSFVEDDEDYSQW